MCTSVGVKGLRNQVNNDRPHQYWIEGSFAVLGLLLAIPSLISDFPALSNQSLLGVLAALLAGTVALTKAFIWDMMSPVLKWPNTVAASLPITAALAELDGLCLQYAIKRLHTAREDIERIKVGRITLTREEYFHQIIECMRSVPKGTQVLAVNVVNVSRWQEDPRQRTYMEANQRAIERGVIIRRLFVMTRDDFAADGGRLAGATVTLQEQAREGIDVAVILRDQVGLQIKDGVLFTQPSARLFLDYPDVADRTRVDHGELVLAPELIRSYQETFIHLLEARLPQSEVDKLLTKP